MYRSYLKIGWRNLLHFKLFSAIKVLGLSIGLSVCILILLYTRDEVSYDKFHANSPRIFRVIQTWYYGERDPQIVGTTNAVMGETYAKEIPEVQQCVRVNGVSVTVKKDNNVFSEYPLFVDNNFFSAFSFPLVEGSASTALKDIHSVTLSEDLAVKYFGTTDVIGKTLQLKLGDKIDDFTVTAITERTPQNSSLKFDMLLPFQYFENYYNNNQGWLGGSMNTFLLLNADADVNSVRIKMQRIFEKNAAEEIAKVKEERGVSLKIEQSLQPLTDIHLSAQPGPDNGMTDGSNPMYSYILSGIALFILIIACINFINLAVGQSLKRAKEIGIRKVVGSTRPELIRQFLVESVLVSLIAFALAFVLTSVSIPFFNELANKKLSIAYLSDRYVFLGLLMLLVITSLLAGMYPSIILSAFRPVKVLYGRQKLMGKNYFTRFLIIVQFALAIFLIIGTIVIHTQVNFLSNADLGYNSDNLVRIIIPVSNLSDPLPGLFKDQLANRKNIISVAARNGGRSISSVKVDGKLIEIENNKIEDNFLSTLGIKLLSGRNFSPLYPSDSLQSVIVNESFVKEAGWSLEEAVGKIIDSMNKSEVPWVVIGVIQDYHYVSLKEKIGPALYSMDPDFNFGQIWVKISDDDIPSTLALLENSFKTLVPYFPYSYEFMSEINAANYDAESRLKLIITIASGLFVFVSCIGLFGLVILSIEQRTKEIGIRKVLGAAVSGIVALISKEFVPLVSVAFVTAIPAGYFVLDSWLQNFPYRVELSWWMFGLAGVVVISMAMLVVCLQTAKAALENPVKSLRSE